MQGRESDNEIGKFANVLTLGNLRRDQSEATLRKKSVVYTIREGGNG
jgi:hypothetical protein